MISKYTWIKKNKENVISIPAALQVRLVNGSDAYEGRVEVLYNGAWGTICDDEWDIYDAYVVCKMLGHSSATMAPTEGRFGEGVGLIAMDDVNCEGMEDNISECTYTNHEDTDCDHSEDAGVVCTKDPLE